MSLNLATILRESARTHPEKSALLFDGGSVSYAELDAASDRFAAGLLARGLRPGDAVVLQLPNVPQFVVAYFGILKAGCVAVPMNVLFKAGEVGYVLTRLRGAAAHHLGRCRRGGREGRGRRGRGRGVRPRHSRVCRTAHVGHRFEQLLETPVVGPPPLHQSDPGDTAVIVYTAGTTGRPKGAELTHFQLFMNADTPGRLFGVRDDDVILTVLPLFHVFGLSSILDVAVRFAATMSLVPRFDADARARGDPARPGHRLRGRPDDVHRAAQPPRPRQLRRVVAARRASRAARRSPARSSTSSSGRFGIVILEGYGLSETASTTTFNVSAEERRIYSVGKPIYGVEVADLGRRRAACCRRGGSTWASWSSAGST